MNTINNKIFTTFNAANNIGRPCFLSAAKGIAAKVSNTIIHKKNFYQNTNNKSLNLSVFGISATIGNLQEAMDVLLYPLLPYHQQFYLVKGGYGVELYQDSKTSISITNSKKIKVETIIPNEIIRIEFRLGFREEQRINLMFRKVVDDLVKNKEVNINLDLGLGEYTSTAWGCDLTYDYVKINAAYRT